MACAVEQNEKNALQLESYCEQQCKYWPKDGKHILAQYDSDSIVVYQAFNKEIAKFALENQRFGGAAYNFNRMSWIKTNFLWMMYRSGWASKPNQDCILAIRLSRKGFDNILENAYSAEYQKQEGLATSEIQVRLQWDPDHKPDYSCEARRAVQLGLKGNILVKFATEWIISIQDVTSLVKDMKKELDTHGISKLSVPSERVYSVNNPKVATQIGLTMFSPD